MRPYTATSEKSLKSDTTINFAKHSHFSVYSILQVA